MGKLRRKVGKKAKNSYNFDIDRRKLRKDAKKLPRLGCPTFKQAYGRGYKFHKNFTNMGLSYDVNKSVNIPRNKDIVLCGGNIDAAIAMKKKPLKSKTDRVVKKMMKLARPRKGEYKVSEEAARFAVYMMDKYGSNYKGMSRDVKNDYQLTPFQIRNRIRQFQKALTQGHGQTCNRRYQNALEDYIGSTERMKSQ